MLAKQPMRNRPARVTTHCSSKPPAGQRGRTARAPDTGTWTRAQECSAEVYKMRLYPAVVHAAVFMVAPAGKAA
eukprot:5661405-Alexandrium_andersonii.AAC.1